MGYMRHHAMVVASWNESLLRKAHWKAGNTFKWVSPVSPEMVNGYRAFFVPPDGSKEGWPESNAGDEQREKFIAWLNKQRYGDGSTSLAWVEVQFGDDERVSKVIRHSDEIEEG